MRVPQHLSGALAIRRRRRRHRLRPGQIDALSAQPDRAGGRHPIAGNRAGRGRGDHQARARPGPARLSRRRAVRAAVGLPLRARGVGTPVALGAAATGVVQALLRAGNPLGRHRPTARGRLRAGGVGIAPGGRGRGRDGVVRRGGRARARSRMASQRAISTRLPAARHSVAAALDRRLARARLRLARQPDAGGRAARRGVAAYGHRTGVTVYNRPASSLNTALGLPMDLGIAGRKAIVCASSRGLGRGCALALAQAGCEVVINGRDGKTLDATAAALRQATGAKVTAVQADVATAEGQAALLGACPEPDILINNNAGPPFRDFRELTRPQMIDGVIANMVVAIELTQKVIDPMVRRQFGRIVNITSGSVKMPLAGLDLSSGARAGLTAFFAGVARAVAASNVTINFLLPGTFDTERLHSNIVANAKSKGISIEQAKA